MAGIGWRLNSIVKAGVGNSLGIDLIFVFEIGNGEIVAIEINDFIKLPPKGFEGGFVVNGCLCSLAGIKGLAEEILSTVFRGGLPRIIIIIKSEFSETALYFGKILVIANGNKLAGA